MPSNKTVIRKVLVVDDENVLRQTLEHLLRAEGFEVRTAADGDAGVELCKTFRPDLAIIDLFMPRQSGLTTIQILRGEFPKLLIVAMSGDADSSTRMATLQSGAIWCIAKPVDFAALSRLIVDLEALVGGASTEVTKPTRTG